MLQSKKFALLLVVAINFPSGENPAQVTASKWPSKVLRESFKRNKDQIVGTYAITAASCTSQIHAFSSSPAVIKSEASGENRQTFTPKLFFGRLLIFSPF